MNENTVNKKDVSKRMAKVVFLFLLTAAILLVSAGNPRWLWGWIYLAFYILYLSAVRSRNGPGFA